jgi:hypothetical protein
MPWRSDGLRIGALAAALMLGTAVAGCSDLYFDRRDTVAFGANNAVATDIALQTIDPWPPASANKNFTTNGPRAAGAIERYRTGKIIQPEGSSTSSANYSAATTPGQGGAPQPVTGGTSGSSSN